MLIPKHWMRPKVQSDEQKQIEKLEQTVTKYKSQEPQFETKAFYDGEETDKIEITRKIPQALTTGNIDELIEDLKRRAPMRTDFSTPPKAKSFKFLFQKDIYDIERIAPDSESITIYQEETYPAWIEECRDVLSNLHKTKISYTSDLPISFEVKNAGTRPAENARIEFLTKGDICISRDCTKDDEVLNEEPVSAPTYPNLPKPPIAPKWKTKKTLKKDAKTNNIQFKGLAEASTALGALAKSYDMTGLASIQKALQSPFLDDVIKK